MRASTDHCWATTTGEEGAKRAEQLAAGMAGAGECCSRALGNGKGVLPGIYN